MKKLFTIAVVLFTTLSFAQLKVSEVTPSGLEKAKIGEYSILGTDYVTLYQFGNLVECVYKDAKFDKIVNYKSFKFKASDLDALYELLTNYENVEKGTLRVVEIEEGDKLSIYYDKMLGTKYVIVEHTDRSGVTGKMANLTPKQLKKLFGK